MRIRVLIIANDCIEAMKLLVKQVMTNKLLVIVSGLSVQLFLVAYDFPVSELFTETPLFYVDNAYHWYYLKLLNNISIDGLLTGYDPFFNAGAPAGIASDVSGHMGQVLAVLFRNSLSEIQAWKLYIFSIAVIGPILPAIGLRALNFSAIKITIALILSILLWWISWFHWFHVVGMGSYVFASFLSLLVILLVLRHRVSPSFVNTLFVCVLGAILVFIHPVIIILVVTLLCCFFVSNSHELKNKKTVYYVVFFIAASVILNSWWLKLFFSPLYQTAYQPVIYQAHVDPANLIYELMGKWSEHIHGSKAYPLLLMLSILAVFQNPSEQRRIYVWPFLSAWFILQVYASLAGMVPVLAKLTQPNRFAPAGYLLLIVPSVFALKWPRRITEFVSVERKSIYVPYVLASLILAVDINELYREVSYGNHGHYAAAPPAVKGTGPYSDFVLSVLKNKTDASARVLFETSMGRIHDGGHLAGYYAYVSDREFIGGPYTSSSFAGFRDGFVFGLPIEEIPPQDFIEYLKLYNVGWIIAHSSASKKYFDSIPNLRPGASFKEIQFYSVNEKYDFFFQGTGVIKERRHNMIHLQELSGNIIELKYHYFHGLKTSPEVRLEGVSKMDDPIPFIRIINPPSSLKIYLD